VTGRRTAAMAARRGPTGLSILLDGGLVPHTS
jgi:hypothetical protein